MHFSRQMSNADRELLNKRLVFDFPGGGETASSNTETNTPAPAAATSLSELMTQLENREGETWEQSYQEAVRTINALKSSNLSEEAKNGYVSRINSALGEIEDMTDAKKDRIATLRGQLISEASGMGAQISLLMPALLSGDFATIIKAFTDWLGGGEDSETATPDAGSSGPPTPRQGPHSNIGGGNAEMITDSSDTRRDSTPGRITFVMNNNIYSVNYNGSQLQQSTAAEDGHFNNITGPAPTLELVTYLDSVKTQTDNIALKLSAANNPTLKGSLAQAVAEKQEAVNAAGSGFPANTNIAARISSYLNSHAPTPADRALAGSNMPAYINQVTNAIRTADAASETATTGPVNLQERISETPANVERVKTNLINQALMIQTELLTEFDQAIRRTNDNQDMNHINSAKTSVSNTLIGLVHILRGSDSTNIQRISAFRDSVNSVKSYLNMPYPYITTAGPTQRDVGQTMLGDRLAGINQSIASIANNALQVAARDPQRDNLNYISQHTTVNESTPQATRLAENPANLLRAKRSLNLKLSSWSTHISLAVDSKIRAGNLPASQRSRVEESLSNINVLTNDAMNQISGEDSILDGVTRFQSVVDDIINNLESTLSGTESDTRKIGPHIFENYANATTGELKKLRDLKTGAMTIAANNPSPDI